MFKKIIFSCILTAIMQVTQTQEKSGTVKQNLSNTCTTCKKSGAANTLKICGKCRTRWYCSQVCQIADWGNHKPACLEASRYPVLNVVTKLKPIKDIIAGYVNTWEEIHSVPALFDKYQNPSMTYSPDGKLLASTVGGKGVAFWSADSMIPHIPFSCFRKQNFPNGKFLVSKVCGREIVFWSADSIPSTKASEGLHFQPATSISFAPDGTLALAIKGDRGFDLCHFEADIPAFVQSPLDVHEISFMPDSNHIAIGTSGPLIIYPLRHRKEIRIPEITGSLKFSPDKKYFSPSLHHKSAITIWDAHTYKLVKTLDHLWESGFKQNHRAVAFSPNGHYFVAGGLGSPAIKLYKMGNYELITTLVTSGVPLAIIFSEDSKYLIVSDDSCTVTVFDIAYGKKIQEQKYARLASLASCPQKNIIAIGLPDRIHIWQAPTTELE